MKNSRFTIVLCQSALTAILTCGYAQAQTYGQMMPAQPYSETVNPGTTYTIRYTVNGTTNTPTALTSLVHVIPMNSYDATTGNGGIIFQGDFIPTAPSTNAWAGTSRTYQATLAVPSTMGDGRYMIAIGMYDPATGQRKAFTTSPPYTNEAVPGNMRYVVGYLNVTRKNIISAPVCATGTTAAIYSSNATILQNAINSLTNGSILKLSDCSYTAATNILNVANKTDVEIVGQGVPSTKLIQMAAGSVNNAGFMLNGMKNLKLRDFQVGNAPSLALVRAPGGTFSATGVRVTGSDGVLVQNMRVSDVAGAGMFFSDSRNVVVTNSEVNRTMADGIHMTGGSTDMTVRANTLTNTGDDGIASVGYNDPATFKSTLMGGTNARISVVGNSITGVVAGSGMTIEGTTDYVGAGNTIKNSGVAGIRVHSDPGWKTGAVTHVKLVNNILDGVSTTVSAQHSPINIWAGNSDIWDIIVDGNVILNPTAANTNAIRMYGTSPYVASNVVVRRNRVVNGTAAAITTCTNTGVGATTNSWETNTLNGAVCN